MSRLWLIALSALILIPLGATAQNDCDTLAIPITEQFEGYGTIPSCWFATRNYDLGQAPHIDSTVSHSGSKSLYLYSGTIAESHYSMVITPPLDVDILDGTFLRLWMKASSTAVRLEVGLCEDTNRYTRAFQPLDTINVAQGGIWQEFVIDLTSYTGIGRRIGLRLQRGLQTAPSECFIDDLSVSNCGTTLPWVNHIGSTTLTVNYEAFGQGTVVVSCGDQMVTGAISPVTFDGLNPETEYQISVACENGLAQTLSATTLEGAGMIPAYYQSFDSIPPTWHFPLACTPSVANGLLSMMPNTDDSCMAVLPMHEDTSSQLNIAIRMKMEGAAQLIVGVMDFANEPESFVAVDTLTASSSWQILYCPLSSYSGDGHYIALLATGSGFIDIDYVRVAHCLLDNVRLYNLTNTAVTIEWDTLSDSATTRIVYFPSDNPEATTVLFPVSNPYTIEDLVPSTEYSIYVASNCLDSLCDYDLHHFITFAHEVTAPYCTGFEDGGNMPLGWVSNDNSASITNNSFYGQYGLQIQTGGSVTLPLIAGTTTDSLILDFYASGNSTLLIGHKETPYSDLEAFDTISVGLQWQHIMVPVVNLPSHCLALFSSNNIAIDAVALRHNAIISAWIDNIDTASASVNWQSVTNDSIVIEFSIVAEEGADFASGTGTRIDTLCNSIVLDGLEPGSYYAVHIAPLEGDLECNYSTLHFRTLSSSIVLPYCTQFDDLGSGGFPADWRRISAMGEYPIASTERYHSRYNSLRFSATNTKSTTAILPYIATCSEHAILEFWTNATSNITGAMLLVGSLEDIADANSFSAIDTITFNHFDRWESHRVNLDTLRRNVALMLVGGSASESRVFIDDLCIQPCLAYNVSINSIDSTNFRVGWNRIGADGLICSVWHNSTLQQVDTLYTSPSVVSGLIPGETYIISFRSLCECGHAGGTNSGGSNTTGNVSTDSVISIGINMVYRPVETPYCYDFDNILTGQSPPYWYWFGSATTTQHFYHSRGLSMKIVGGSTIVLPSMNNIAEHTALLYAYATDESALADNAIVLGTLKYYDSLSSFLPTDTLHISNMGRWERLVGDLAADTGGSHYIALRFNAPNTSALYIDDIGIAKCAILDATVSADGTLVWQGLHDPQGIVLEYGTVGFASGTGMTDTALTSPHTIADFPTGMAVEVRMHPLCTTGSNPCDEYIYTVGGGTSIPYCEYFDGTDGNAMPKEWSVSRTFSLTPAIASSNGGKALNLKANTSNRSIVSLPLPINASLDTLQLNFSMLTPNSNRSRLIVGEIENPADPNTFYPTDTVGNSTSNVWQRLRVPLVHHAHSDWHPAICCISINQEAEIWIDSLSITRTVPPQVSVVGARNVSLHSDSIPYYIEYGEAGFIQGTGTSLYIDTTEYHLSSLIPGLSYHFYTHLTEDEVSCLAPLNVTMPNETALPYCHGDAQFSRLQLPELAIDSVNQLHLYFTLRGGTPLEIGVMNATGDWDNLVAVDTLDIPSGIWQKVHVDMHPYSGHGRFVALRTTNGGIATINALTVSECELPSATLNPDNTVSLTGNGSIEYGPEGFSLGSGTWVDISGQPTVISQLDENTTYDFYPICNNRVPCYQPITLTTTGTIHLPYCVSLSNQLPAGWATSTNAATALPVQMLDSCLSINVSNGQSVTITTPHMDEPSVVMDFEMLVSTTDVNLVIGNDTIRNSGTNHWQQHRLGTTHNGRITMQVSGNGNVKLRNMIIDLCATPLELSVAQPGDGRVQLSWDSAGIDSTAFLVYSLGSQDIGTAVPIGTPPLSLQLQPDTTYSLYLRCSNDATCREPFSITTLAAPLTIPYCYIDDGSTPAMPPAGWRTIGDSYFVLPQFSDVELHDLNIIFYASTADGSDLNVTVGTMYNANDASTFDSIATFSSHGNRKVRCFHTFADYYGNGRFIALHSNNGAALRVDSVSVSDCMAYNITMSETEADHVVFEWEHQGTPSVSVEYGEPGFAAGSGTTVSSSSSPMQIDGLSALVNYAFYVSYGYDGNNCRKPVVDTFFIFTPQGGTGCIDYTDLRASYVTCHYGSYNNPNENIGTIDHGYTSPLSRHTVHFDTSERDPRTGMMLRAVPVGAQASVRLGNWTTGGNGAPEAESVTYALNVDSSEFELLILKYAAVLQDPEHATYLQPRFRLQILNPQGELIDSCGMADFIANHALGWHEAAGDVLWKDWTTVGIDISPYSGQTILVRLTTNDCGEGSHFGYAYFTLECAKKSLRTEGCSNVPSYRFSVPNGFNYRWYTNLDPETTISDSASIIVPSDNSVTYYCNLSFIDNPSCNFTMSAFSGARFALALMDTMLTTSDCTMTLLLSNQSTISPDGINPDGSGDEVDSISWFLPDTILHDQQVSIVFQDTGYYPVTLVAGIADNRCTDTLSYNIRINWQHQRPFIEGRDRRCTAEDPDTICVHNTVSYQWTDNSTGDIVIAPPHDSTFVVYSVDSNGCYDTLSHTLLVYTSYHSDAIDSLCSYDTTYLWRDSTLILSPHTPSAPPTYPSATYSPFAPLHFTDSLTTIDLCDSIFTLTLQPMPHYFIEHRDSICHDQSFPFFDMLLDSTGSYLHQGFTAFGCDSLVTQHLHVIPRSFTDDTREVCDSMRWINGELYTDNVNGISHTLYSTYGCDSIIRLYLTVNRSSYHLDSDTVCAGTSYGWRNHVLANEYPEVLMTYYVVDTLSSVHNCDSVLALSLTRIPKPHISIHADHNCTNEGYTLHSGSDASYFVWSSWPYDPSLEGHEYDSVINIVPQRNTTYTLYADYSSIPVCPTTSKISLNPYFLPVAKMRVSTYTITDTRPDFEAVDVSEEYGFRMWFVDNEPLEDTSRHIKMTAPTGIDSLTVMLVVNDSYCSDSTQHTIPVERSYFAIPNAFTPTQETNNLFIVKGLNIASYEIFIYDRHGVLVYHSTDINASWDGHGRNGVLCPPANYAFVINYSTTFRPTAIQKQVGTVLLLR